MKKIIFKKLIEDVTKFFLLTSISLSLIILVVQAVSFLDYISEDGHGFVTYFGITILNLPKIYTRVMPFCIFITIFYIINKYEVKNELVLFWSIGIKKIKFINVLVTFSLFFFLFQLLLNNIIVPKSLDQARDFIRNSKIDFFPNLIKEKKFIDAVESLTIFVDSKTRDGNLKNIYLKDNLSDDRSQIIYAKEGQIIFDGNKNYLMLFNGNFIDIDKEKITTFSFKRTEFDLSKYKTKTTIYPKIQEINSFGIFLCLYKIKFNQNYNFPEKYFLRCNKDQYSDLVEEAFKRSIKPLFIPVIVLFSTLIIIFNKDNFRYNKIQYFLFSIVFLIIVFSEISSRYINNLSSTVIFSIIPLLLLMMGYIFLTVTLKDAND
tara:strand:+ start:320 stop:1447 length:1128 start_codon:yes stop_codon:yes gene_type:complete